MLVLTRRVGESISIGKDIRIVVVQVKGKQVRIGIDAPADVVILREEAKNKEVKKSYADEYGSIKQSKNK